MKNLQIFNNLKKDIKYKVERSIKHKIALLGLSTTLAATSLAGCGRESTNDYDLKTAVEALHQDDELTKIDNILLENNIEELDKKYRKAYNESDIEKCNEIISKMSELMIKALITEGYNIDFNKIKNFKVIGLIGKRYDMDENATSYSEYGIKFEYENNIYTIEAPRGISRKLCVITRAGKKNQLVGKRKETDFPYFYLPQTYEVIKGATMTILGFKNKEHTHKYDKEVGYKYDGYFTFKKDKKRTRIVKKYIKDLESTTEKEESINNLPKKRK